MAKSWVVDGCELELSKGDGDIEISTKPEKDVFAGKKDDPKKVYAGSLGFTISNYQDDSITDGNGAGGGVINGTSVNLANGKKILLEGDNVSVTLVGTSTTGTKTDPAESTITVKIGKAGQSEVQSN